MGGQGMEFTFSPDDSNPGAGTFFGAWYTYDAAGNRLTADETGDATSSQTLTYNAASPSTTTRMARLTRTGFP